MILTPDPYTAARDYRHALAELLTRATHQFDGMLVRIKDASIYAEAMRAVIPPDVPGPDYAAILNSALVQLKTMVNA